MSNTPMLIAALLICAVGLSMAGVYFGGQVLRRLFKTPAVNPRGGRGRHRRNLGMVIVAVISLATILGATLVDPMSSPIHFAYYWLILIMMILWLVVLAFADLRQTLLKYGRVGGPLERIRVLQDDGTLSRDGSRSTSSIQDEDER